MVSLIPSNLIRQLRNLGFGDQPEHGNSEDEHSAEERSTDEPYYPTPVDLCIVRIMLGRSMKLPPTVIDDIFDHAEYWARSSNEVDFVLQHQSPLSISGSGGNQDKFLIRSFPVGLTGIRARQDLSEELAYDLNEAKPHTLLAEHDPSYFAELADYPTPKLIRPVRKVVFSIRSHDQGWASGDREHNGTFKSTWTWFEAGLERFDKEQTCDTHCTYDVRFKSKDTIASPLPICALRALHPEIEPMPPKQRETDDTQHKPGDDSDQEEEEEEAKKEEQKEEETFKYKHPLHPNEKWTIQRNKRATRSWQDYQVTWHYLDDTKADSDEGKKLDEELGRGRETGDGSFVRDLKLGDVITVWGKARFGGWVNTVETVKIDVYWAV